MATRTTSAPTLSTELRQLLRRVKLGRTIEAMPERLALARSSKLSHAEFLELVLADEVERRDRASNTLRARKARLDPAMTIHTWDGDANITYDHDIWAELTSLRFVDDARCAFILGPVGVGKTHLAHALGHQAIARRHKVLAIRAEQLFNQLKASRLDNSHAEHIRRLVATDVLILDDFALQPMDAVATADFYELIVERHHKAATVITSNRDSVEWLTALADPLLAQSAIDRLASAAWELVIEGESYRQHQRPTLTTPKGATR